MIASERMSDTRLLYPKDTPRSHTMMLAPSPPASIAAARALSTTFFMSCGARNCPFLMFTGRPAQATARMKSV